MVKKVKAFKYIRQLSEMQFLLGTHLKRYQKKVFNCETFSELCILN